MPIKISYTEPLKPNEDELLEKFNELAVSAEIELEEYDDSSKSGLPPVPVKRPKK